MVFFVVDSQKLVSFSVENGILGQKIFLKMHAKCTKKNCNLYVKFDSKVKKRGVIGCGLIKQRGSLGVGSA